MGNSKMVFAVRFLSSALVLSILSTNCGSREIGDQGAGGGQFSDSFHQVLDCAYGFSVEAEDEQHIAWEMSVRGLNTIAGPNLSLTFQDLYGNSTPTALSVCDLISNQRVLVVICTLNSQELSSMTPGIDDFTTKLPTPCGEPVLSKAKLVTVSSVMYMVRHTSGKVSCLVSALISSINWQEAFEEDLKFHRDDSDIFTLNLTSIAAHSSNEVKKVWGLIEMDEASSLLATSMPLQWIWSDDVGCKGALVGTRRNYRSQESGSRFPAGKTVLRIGVPVRSNITEFVSVKNDENRRTNITGFSINVFEAAVRRLPYKFTYKLIPFYGSSDELVKKVARESFDVGVGDIIIQAGQHQPVEFSLPYLEPGFMMVSKAKNTKLNNFWWLLRPFTLEMWLTLGALSLFTGLVIWITERDDNDDGPNLIEALLFLHGQPLRQITSRIIMAVWLLVVLILTQSYTSMIASELTMPWRLDLDSLKNTNAAIGCDGQSQSILYLVKVLGFKRRNIRTIASIDEYEEALSSGNIKAAFLSTPYAKLFLAKHCADFYEINLPASYNLGGFGFVFPKASPLALDISAAILELEESGELQLMEEEMPSLSDCAGKLFEDSTTQSIGPSSFIGLFVFSGGTSVISLLIILMPRLNRYWEGRIQRMLMGRELWLWLTTVFIRNQRRNIDQFQAGQ